MVASGQHLYQAIVQFDNSINYPENLQQEVYMTSFLLMPPSGYSIWGTENSQTVFSLKHSGVQGL